MKILGYYILPEAQVDGIAKELKMTRKQLKAEKYTSQRLRQDYKHMLSYVADIKKILLEETRDERKGAESGDPGGAGTSSPSSS